ncbi:DUF1214 domain-containing protein [uncultured Microbulbifer sp.]|uniref:DUF1254 domain-containing protein n=1 Tax=uncultured Microbulbifer sp. TaxID=348147 RepID=UPI0025D2F7E3|nr:DUF1214 domain-containing protein [uncultured Microbulbifer sp.]
MKWIVTVTASVLVLVLGAFASAQQKNDTKTEIAKEAYLFTYPLVMNYRTMYKQAIEGDRDFGKWLHLGISSPKDTDIVTPNNDTPYSYVWVDLRAEPWVLTLPKIEKERFYTSQWDDLWGYVLDNPGSVNDGNDGINVLLVAPDWIGEKPKGIDRIIRGESDFLGSLTRTQLIGGKGDLPRGKEIQQSYKVQPLSAYLGTKAPAAAAKIDWPSWEEGAELTDKYWDYVSFILPLTTRNAADSAMYAKLQQLGMAVKGGWKFSELPAETQKALRQGIKDAREQMDRRGRSKYNPADFFGTREQIGTDYANRAEGVYLGIFGNVPQQSVYLTDPNDVNGKETDGSKASYTVTFPKGKLPPVDYFWSYTMYRLPERFLVDNPLDRYSIGSSTKGLKHNPDGSLTLYFSHESPGKDKESNWLPAPDGPFWVVLRTYGPSQQIIDGTYKQPDYIPQQLK